MIYDAGYQGAFKTFKDTASAVRFLNITVSEDGVLVAADLLFLSFDIHGENLHQVIDCFSADMQDTNIQMKS